MKEQPFQTSRAPERSFRIDSHVITAPNETGEVFDRIAGSMETDENGVAICRGENGKGNTRLAIVRRSSQGYVHEPLIFTKDAAVPVLILPIPLGASPDYGIFVGGDPKPENDGTKNAVVARIFDPLTNKLHLLASFEGDGNREISYILDGKRKEQEARVAENLELFDRLGFNPETTRGIFSKVRLEDQKPSKTSPIKLFPGIVLQVNTYRITPHPLPHLPEVHSLETSFPIATITH